jgi:EAL domain-containing protein (putative c-di-GMP-specific phosphodiesterase class I)
LSDVELTTAIAEWAENAEIVEVLRGLGVDYAQGYGVSQPQRVQRAAIA